MDKIHIAIPAAGAAFKFYAEVTAFSARQGSSMPIEFHFVDMDDFSRVADVSRFGLYHGSPITWSRLYLPEMFPDLDWIISCDADVMFFGDVAELWRLRDDSVWALPSRDNPMPGIPYNLNAVDWYRRNYFEFEHPEKYFCAGITLFNLKVMRENGWGKLRDDFLLKVADVNSIPLADQGVLNYLLQDRVRLLPRRWGLFSGDENADIDWSKSFAVHFVEDTPWRRWKITHLASDLYEMWWGMAEKMSPQMVYEPDKPYLYRGCRCRMDWFWRRALFVLLKNNQWILRLNHRLWLHFRNTRGIGNHVLCK